MSCRETRSGSMITSWAMFTAPRRALTEPAVLSTFHQLRRNYMETAEEGRRTYSQADYDGLLDRQENRFRVERARGSITQRQYDSLMERLNVARGEAMPDQGHVYAMFNLVPAVRNRTEAWLGVARDISNRTGQSFDDVLTQMETDRRGRTSRNTELPDGAMERAVELGLPRDAGTVYAYAMAEAEARRIEIVQARNAPRRITRTELDPPAETGVAGVTVTEVGYDARSGRLEVTVADSVTGEATTHAYRDVPQDVASVVIMNPGGGWHRHVRGHPAYQYADEYAEALGGVAPRCDVCGQFADAAHSCPTPRTPVRMSPWDHGTRWTQQRRRAFGVNADGELQEWTETVRLPAIRRLQQAVNSPDGASVSMDRYQSIRAFDDDGVLRSGVISGNYLVSRDENGDLVIDTSEARCNCPLYRQNGHCPHVDLVSRHIRDRVERPSEAQQAEAARVDREAALQEAATRVERAMERARASDWSRNAAAWEEAAEVWRRDSDVLYAEDEAAFAADVQAALDARAAKDGSPDIPYMRENALDGMATRESGQGFGAEIEFKFDPDMSYSERAAALDRIAQELHEAGITRSPRQESYGFSRRFGFVDSHTLDDGTGTWVFERDGSVDGELVTCVMYDEPETWDRMEKAMEILRRNGARADVSAGAHVHVGTGGFQGSPAAYSELARMVNQHEDVIVRLATDPQRGTHRDNGYSRPLPAVPVTGFQDVSAVPRWQRERYSMVNFAHVAGSRGDHPEFRIFDSTLDAGSMQAQIKMAVAMTHAAQRSADNGGTSRDREGWGDHARRNPNAGERTVESLVEDSATVRSFIDTLFRRREDKAQMAAVFANTSWSAAPRRH